MESVVGDAGRFAPGEEVMERTAAGAGRAE